MAKKRNYDESDARVRPSRSSRARTKDRPAHEGALVGFVFQVDRGRTFCITDDGLIIQAMKARELGKNSVVVGDRVKIVGDVTGDEGSLARIVTVVARENSLTRTVDDVGAIPRVIVANVDQMVIVVAAANPEPRAGLIDRALVVAYDQAITPIIAMTKRDLADPSQFLAPYKVLGITSLIIQRGDDLTSMKEILADRVSVFIGHSGVGKSTLVNALTENKDLSTGDVNDVTGRGRHTSSSVIALKLDGIDTGWIIDTPGLRSFGLHHIDKSRVISAFSEFAEIIKRCQKNCSHTQEDCSLKIWADGEPERLERYQSLQRLLNS